MKKLIVGILSATFILGAGSYAFAQGTEDGILGFDQMKPYMEQMHPDFSENELQNMYNACHGEGGMMQNNPPAGMMNRL
ncbi:hypothetical protein M3181_21495 [Mesobacillus maritimus]|uniref:hypothetical protein n=1 Tax=Mesobacillus maritimus TaxID=1643336 RepID=UPI00203D6E66|nr:hypothetical protein [Mesobacillus maritimus]MCM3671538.1 hypothetical protein [Mesobacillus maritimus]